MSSISVRVATPDDAAAVQEIYAPYIETTAISFEMKVPTVAEMRGRIEEKLELYPWLVAELESEVVGYIYGGRFAPRSAYLWSVESSLYVSMNHRRMGIGRLMYDHLLPILKQQRFRMVYAGIALPNEPSSGLHEALGFHQVANFENAGFKFDAWHAVGWWQLDLYPDLGADERMDEPIPFPQLNL